MSEGKVEQWIEEATIELVRLMEKAFEGHSLPHSTIQHVIAAHAPSLAAAYERGVRHSVTRMRWLTVTGSRDGYQQGWNAALKRAEDASLSLLQANPYVETEEKK